MAGKKKQRPKRKSIKGPRIRRTPSKLIPRLEEVERLTNRKRWGEALEELQELDHRFPNRPEVLSELVNVCYELQDMRLYLLYCQRLFKLLPNEPDLMFGLAGAYMVNFYPALALQLYNQFVIRYPNYERIEDAQEARQILEEGMEQILADLGVSGEEGLTLAADHDQIRAYLESGEFKAGRQAAQKLLKYKPDFIPALNNLSMLDFMEGKLEQAIATARQSLDLDPNNFQALGNLTRYLFMTGQTDESQQFAEQLKATESDSPDIWIKKAETFTYLGDDQSVLDTFHAAEESGELETPTTNPILYHFAAVAAMRQGDEKQAKTYWQQTLKLNPNFELAHKNLLDLKLPVGERHAPWPFTVRQWISQQAADDMTRYWLPATRRNNEAALTKAAGRYLKLHPEMKILVPILLERGDPQGREFAVGLATIAETPELLAALKDFVLSRHGPDELRHQALRTVKQAGLMPPGPVRMWLKGEWQEIVSMDFEIYEEPVDKGFPEEVDEWLAEGTEALRNNEAEEAERLFKQALEIVPNDPTLLNNLGAAYDQQGRKDEVHALIHQINEQHPDYFFGIVGKASLLINDGNIEQAEELLWPLLSQERLHISEFVALCRAHIQLYLAKDMPEGAESWLNMWADVDPDHPEYGYWERRLWLHKMKGKSNWRKLFGFGGKSE